jgi:hypothetical protein
VGEFSVQPYDFINLVPVIPGQDVKPALVIRLGYHWHQALPTPSERKSDTSRYHKGWLDDELAALASLILGVRLQCGATTREFRPDGDPKGNPTYVNRKRVYGLPAKDQLRLPPPEEPPLLDGLSSLSHLAELSPQQSVALVKAARLYQQALWHAEIDSADAWLLLVSAVETAATCWKGQRRSVMEEFEDGSPTLFNFLRPLGDDSMLEGVAKILHGKTKVQMKFVDFLIRFLPSPPPQRPPDVFQIPWIPEQLRVAFSKIYDHRSRALHDGIGFPFPMTERPMRIGHEKGTFSERPAGLMTSTLGATWDREDSPMFLHVFAYIVQRSLLAWWDFEATK